jgi:hypothetical protein
MFSTAFGVVFSRQLSNKFEELAWHERALDLRAAVMDLEKMKRSPIVRHAGAPLCAPDLVKLPAAGNHASLPPPEAVSSATLIPSGRPPARRSISPISPRTRLSLYFIGE